MNNNYPSLYKELAQHIVNDIGDKLWLPIEDLHYHLFNESHYIVGYYQAKEWLKEHKYDTFDAIDCVQTYEGDNFGERHTAINSESIVNMLVYIIGEEIIGELQGEIDFDEFDNLDREFISQVKDYLTEEYKL